MRVCSQCQAEIADIARFCPYCGAVNTGSPEPSGDPFVGHTINGKYRIESLLGQGGMGRVYKAIHLTLEKVVVLKMLHKGFSEDPAVAERFKREAKAASKLNHPNSIAVLDFGEAEDGTLFMAMEFLAGRDLAHLIVEDYPIGDNRVVRIGAQILSALAEAHAHGIIHRDLKPENVMVEPRRDEPDYVKVLDFGIAKIIAPGPDEPKLTQAGLVCGTPEYMSPEQAAGRELDPRSDLYSVGIILYQMVVGDLPFSSETPIGFLTKHLTETPIPPSQKRSGVTVSPALEGLILRTLAKEPHVRPESAEAMRAELLACIAPIVKLAPADRPTEKMEMPEPGATRRPFIAVAAALLLLAMVGGGLFTARMWHSWFPAPSVKDLDATGTAVAGGGEVDSGVAAENDAGPSLGEADAGEMTGSDAGLVAVEDAGLPDAGPSRPPQRRPDRARAVELYTKAEECRVEAKPDCAIQNYLLAEAADPTLHNVQKKLGLLYQAKNDRAKAIERFERYLRTKPEDAEAVREILRGLRHSESD